MHWQETGQLWNLFNVFLRGAESYTYCPLFDIALSFILSTRTILYKAKATFDTTLLSPGAERLSQGQKHHPPLHFLQRLTLSSVCMCVGVLAEARGVLDLLELELRVGVRTELGSFVLCLLAHFSLSF